MTGRLDQVMTVGMTGKIGSRVGNGKKLSIDEMR